MNSMVKIIPVVVLVALAGCDNMTRSEQRIVSGAAIGTVGGAAIGAISGDAGVGALIGAGVGAIGGALVEGNDRYYDDYDNYD